jgi:serine O-acetyltransferase
MLSTIRNDIDVIFKRDPAARSRLEVVLSYPGLHALWGYRFSHWLWVRGHKLLGRTSSQLTRAITGIEIHPGAMIGDGFFIDHGMGVVIGETSEIGNNVTLYHGVTLGGVSLEKGKRHPTLEDDVVVGAGAKILGAITIGAGSRIGANSVVVKSVPSDSVVVGVPGRVVEQNHPLHHEADFHHDRLPDTIGQTLVEVLNRLDALEKFEQTLAPEKTRTILRLKGNGNGGNGHKQPTAAEIAHQRGLDFMI